MEDAVDYPFPNITKLALPSSCRPSCSVRRLRKDPVPLNRPAPSARAAEIHYGPGEDLERIDVALIREAAKQIDMAAYVLTDSAVIEALRDASVARGEGASLARRQRSGETKRIRRGGAARRTGSGPRNSIKRAGRRTDAPERLLRRSSPFAHRLGQFQPIRRNAPGQ